METHRLSVEDAYAQTRCSSVQAKVILISIFCLLTAIIILFSSRAAATEEDLDSLYQRTRILQEEMQQLQHRYGAQIEALEKRIMELEKMENHNPQPAPHIAIATDGDGVAHRPEADLEWSLSGLVAMGGSDADAGELEQLQGGSHDPRKNGFTIQALALAVHADINPQLDATASIVSHIEPDGESVVELEQAYIRTTELPLGLSAMAGQFFLDFGEENKRHPDDWDFVDVPFLITRLFGSDKLRSQGVQIAWDTPLPWRSTLVLGASNPSGETVTSFLYKQDEQVGGYALQELDVEGLDDLLYLIKWSHRLPAAAHEKIGLGISSLFGPNATGRSTDTQIYGLNLEWTRYHSSHKHQRLFDWRTEVMYRRYEAGDRSDPASDTLSDYGVFSQVIWQLAHNRVTGFRAEFADSNNESGSDPLRENRKRFSVNHTHLVSPSVRLRLQFNHDRADYLSSDSANSVWMQLVYQSGGHNEH